MARFNRDVYAHLLRTYGRRPGVWVGVLAGLTRPLLLIVAAAFVTSALASNVAAGDMAAAQRNILYLFLLNVVGVFLPALGELIAVRAENSTYYELLMRYYRKLVGKDMAFYRDHQTGYLTSLIRQYLDSSMLLLRLFRSEGSRVLVALTAPVIVLAILDWRLGLVTLGIIAAQLVYIFWSSARAHQHRQRSHEIYRKVTGEVADSITNIVAFKSSGREKEGYGKVSQLAAEEIETFWLRRKVTTLLDLPRGLITSAGVAALFFVIISSNASGPQAVGVIVLVLSYTLSIIRNVNDLPMIMSNHDDLVTKLHPTLAYLGDQHETIRDPVKPKKLQVKTGAIGIDSIRFEYPSHSAHGRPIPVFRDLSIHIKGGEHIGIVGLSGAGKSTLASLLMRFDEVTSGSIAIDGTNIREVKQADLHCAIAYVPQEPLLFHRTIKENIAYFNGRAAMKQIENAARAAHAHEFISKLPDGYDTVVGERGVKLSGGQKQRVVIARSILKNAPIMIFDEATSALDSESEKIIQRALPDIIGKHTAIVIAHRLSTIADMDRILVMHDGQVVEEGTHRQLLKRRGRYYSLWQKQSGGNQAKTARPNTAVASAQ